MVALLILALSLGLGHGRKVRIGWRLDCQVLPSTGTLAVGVRLLIGWCGRTGVAIGKPDVADDKRGHGDKLRRRRICSYSTEGAAKIQSRVTPTKTACLLTEPRGRGNLASRTEESLVEFWPSLGDQRN